MGVERRSTIAAGVDGSPESMVAARWAAREAQRRRLTLEMLLGINEPLENQSGDVFPAPVIEAVRTDSRRRLDRAAQVIRDEYPDLDVQTSLEYIDPRRALVTRSRHASMTVVGTRGHGRLPEILVGSVALYVAAHAHSPVAVVPPVADISATGPSGPVLVGVDGHPNCGAGFHQSAGDDPCGRPGHRRATGGRRLTPTGGRTTTIRTHWQSPSMFPTRGGRHESSRG